MSWLLYVEQIFTTVKNVVFFIYSWSMMTSLAYIECEMFTMLEYLLETIEEGGAENTHNVDHSVHWEEERDGHVAQNIQNWKEQVKEKKTHMFGKFASWTVTDVQRRWDTKKTAAKP